MRGALARSSEFVQLRDSGLESVGESYDLVGRITAGAKCVLYLFRRELGQKRSHPFGVSSGHTISHPSHADLMNEVEKMKNVEQRWAPGKTEIYIFGRNPGDEFGVLIGLQIIFRSSLSKAIA